MPFTPRKYAKKAYKKVYGSRKYPAAIKKTGEVAKDIAGLTASVAMIMGRLNVEKHHKDRDVITTTFGQVNGNADGAHYQDVTPVISQGNTEDDRKGNSLKLTGLSFPIQMSGLTNCSGPRKIRISLLKVKSADNGVSAQEAFEQYWDTNPLTGVRDFNCERNYRSGAHDGITCVRSSTYYLKPLERVGTLVDSEKSIITTKFVVKLNDVLRFSTDTSTTPDGLKYYLIFQADSGNESSSSSTLDVPVPDSNSGMAIRLAQRTWFVDN